MDAVDKEMERMEESISRFMEQMTIKEKWGRFDQADTFEKMEKLAQYAIHVAKEHLQESMKRLLRYERALVEEKQKGDRLAEENKKMLEQLREVENRAIQNQLGVQPPASSPVEPSSSLMQGMMNPSVLPPIPTPVTDPSFSSMPGPVNFSIPQQSGIPPLPELQYSPGQPATMPPLPKMNFPMADSMNPLPQPPVPQMPAMPQMPPALDFQFPPMPGSVNSQRSPQIPYPSFPSATEQGAMPSLQPPVPENKGYFPPYVPEMPESAPQTAQSADSAALSAYEKIMEDVRAREKIKSLDAEAIEVGNKIASAEKLLQEMYGVRGQIQKEKTELSSRGRPDGMGTLPTL